MYDHSTILSSIKEFNQLRRESQRFSSSLSRYTHFTVDQFILEYNTNGLKGKAVYDKLIKIIAPEELLPKEKIKVAPKVIERFTIEDLLTHKKREIPYVSNMYESVGKLMDVAICQAIEVLEKSSKSLSSKYSQVLRCYFLEHKSVDEIAKIIDDSNWNVRGNILNRFMKGEDFYANICISPLFKQQVKSLIDPMLFQACNTMFEDNDIDTPEKINFAIVLTGYDILADMKEWGNAKVLTKDSYINTTRQHLISLKKAICESIVPVSLSDLVEKTKADFITKNDLSDFNVQIIENFLKTHPWVETNDEDCFYIQTPHLENIYHRQGRIIFEEGGLIHHKKVKSIYETIYGETYKLNGISPSLRNRSEQDFLPYGKTGQWYYSEDGSQLPLPNKAISNFVDGHIHFYWKDLAGVVSQLTRVNKNLNARRIRMEITNLCYVDSQDNNHFVKKGEEDKYPHFSWNKGKQNRTNWIINHAYEILKDAPEKKMAWSAFEKQFKDDIVETGRPLKVIEDLKYKHSGEDESKYIFIRKDGYIRINEDVVQKNYNGDLSMVGLFRKYPEYYNILYSLAMTELRKQSENKMLLTDFINLAVENIESEGKVDGAFVRKAFSNNDNLPEGLTRYNEEGSVYIKLDVVLADEEVKDDVQYEVTSASVDDAQSAPVLAISSVTREPVTSATRFTWTDVKSALKKDLEFYDNSRWLDGITSDEVLDHFVNTISNSKNYNLNQMLPQIIYEFHYARIDRYDHIQYIRNLPIAFEALLREIYESCHRPSYSKGIYKLCEEGFHDYAQSIKYNDRRGFGGILCDLVHKRNLLLHGMNLELSPVTLVLTVLQYIALFVYTVDKYAMDNY